MTERQVASRARFAAERQRKTNIGYHPAPLPGDGPRPIRHLF